jgi:hypothetical protein
MKLFIYNDSLINTRIILIENLLLFITVVPHSNQFMNQMAAKQSNSSGHISLLNYKTCYYRPETIPKMGKKKAEAGGTVSKDFIGVNRHQC